MTGKMVLLDGYSLMYRAYHALQTPMSAPDGTPTNAVHGFVTMLLKVIDEENPDYLAVAFDVHAPTLRAQRYAAYKATRKPMPDDLRAQDPIIRELIGLMNIPILEMAGYEADDILGTLSLACERMGMETLIVSGDRDLYQLVDAHTSILYTKKGISDTVRVTPAYIEDTYGLKPEQLIDVKGLMGDSSDNIPGVAGIGEKTALKLISEYQTLETVLDRAETEQKGKLRERLMEHREMAELSKELATIDRYAPVEVNLELFRMGNLSGALPRLRSLNMNMAARRLSEVAAKRAPEAVVAEVEPSEALPPVEQLDHVEALRARCAELAKTAKWVAVDAGADFTLATDAARLRVRFGGDLLSSGITEDEAFQAAQALLERDCDKYLYDVKSLPLDIRLYPGRMIDVMLAAYALNPQRESFAAQMLCEAAGVERFSEHPASALYRLGAIQLEELVRNELEEIYFGMELPLAFVLRDMEKQGFLVDAQVLEALGRTFRARISELTAEIYELMGGVRINLNSPKQLGEMLFDRMGLPAVHKTQRGYSVNAEVLEQLAEDYPVCAKILEYRKYQKLESTYIESLLKMRDSEGRIHTRFDQVGTSTGRLSSSEPNLQNIPVRTELGREIRRAFVARPGWTLVDADYSQIELRVLAHISGDPTMRSAFLNDEDIHTRTAAEVYGVPIDAVTSDMRTASKAVNFGIVYGISDFALAKNISVSRKEARAFIDRYFERYPKVKAYMDRSVEEGKRLGYVTTLLNRRRYLPELTSANYNVRSFGERCAMNSPIQGTAADIIKMAMIAVARALEEQKLRARLILQVHDELIVEAPQEEVEQVRALLADCMEGIVQLSVPLKTAISVGGDWRACK